RLGVDALELLVDPQDQVLAATRLGQVQGREVVAGHQRPGLLAVAPEPGDLPLRQRLLGLLADPLEVLQRGPEPPLGLVEPAEPPEDPPLAPANGGHASGNGPEANRSSALAASTSASSSRSSARYRAARSLRAYPSSTDHCPATAPLMLESSQPPAS